MNDRPDNRFMLEQIARENAPWAAFAGALLIVFGFFAFAMPAPEGLFSTGDFIFQWTLRIGGILLVLAALACWAGVAVAMMLDSVVSVLAGMGMILGSLLMIAGAGGAGLQQLLYLIFGGLFIFVGFRNARTYLALAGSASNAGGYDPHFQEQYERARQSGGAPSLAAQLKDRARAPDQPDAGPETGPRSSEAAAPAAEEPDTPADEPDRPDDERHQRARRQEEPPEGGFLSGFADDEPPPRM